MSKSRTQAFFWVQFAVLTSEFLAPPLGSLLMEALGPHLTFLAGVPLELIGFLIILIIPGNAAINSGNTPLESSNTPSVTHSVEAGESLGNKLKRVPYRLILYVRQDIISITSRRPFLIGLLALVVAKMARPLIELTLQFMSIKFDWPIRKVFYPKRPECGQPSDHLRRQVSSCLPKQPVKYFYLPSSFQ